MAIATPQESVYARHIYHLYTIRFADRERLQSKLQNTGIACDVYYPCPPHLAEPCRRLGYQSGDFPVAELASRETLSIPLYPEMKLAQIHFVLETIQQTLEKEKI